jgi:hypothetical protein
MRRPTIPRLLVAWTASVALVVGATAPSSAAPVFSDGFESGDLSAWTKTKNFSAQQALVFSGLWAGRAISPGGTVALASKTLSSAQSELYLDARVDLVSMGGSNTILLRFGTAGGSPLASLNVNSSGKLWVKNHVAGTKRTSSAVMSTGAWHELQLHARVDSSSLIEVWLDGAQLNDLTVTDPLGTAPIGRVQLGGSSSAFDAAFDDVVVDTAFVGGGGAPPPTPTNLRATDVTSSTVDLAWDPSAGATSYQVKRDGAVVGTPTGASFKDTGLSASTSYSYTVAACNSAGCSGDSAALSVTTDPPAAGLVLAAAGDIACDPADPYFNGGEGTSTRCRQKYTAALLSGADAVIPLGDTQYECGGLQAFQQSYDPTWGQYKSITHPVVADHEYDTTGTDCGAAGADGYFSYFGDAAHGPGGYYSFDVGSWHVVVLNSVCNKVGGCEEGSPQNDWLEQDLAANTAACTLAAFHHPRFVSHSTKPVRDRTLPFWEDLYADGAEIILNGNAHVYERFHPQDPSGNLDPNGIVEFIVGTGGKSHGSLASPRSPNSAAGSDQDFGVLRLTLRDGGYDWEFVPEGSSTFSDSGSASCH